ncbi:MAG: cache domain-containing protein [Patescibacteria group bacterium]
MPLSFLVNNFHFALELLGATACLMAAWLTLDTYLLRKEASTLFRAIGFGLFAVWQFIYAVNLGSDLLSYVGFFFYLIGLVFILGSFGKSQQLKVEAIVVIPAFTLWSGYLHVAAGLLLFGIAFLSYRRFKQELNKTWLPLSLGFAFLAVGALLGAVSGGSQTSLPFIAELVCELLGFGLLIKWVWQFLALRIRESLVLVFISAALFLSTVVTLAFSTILISQIASETESNLRTDTQVMLLAVDGLREQSLAKATLFSKESELATAVSKNDFASLEQLSEAFMEEYTLGFLTITDKDGSVLVRANALSRRGDSLLGERAVEEALAGESIVTIEKSPVEKLSIRAAAPIIQNGKILGVVVAGYPLDNALVDNIKRVTGLEMFVYEGDTSVAATAFAQDGRTRVVGTVVDTGTKEKVLTLGEPTSAQALIYGKPFRASYLPLENADKKIIGMISAAKPEQDILDIANSTNRLTLITIVCIMLVLAYPIYLFTKRLTAE